MDGGSLRRFARDGRRVAGVTGLLAFLARRSRGFILLAGALLILLLGVVNYLTGPELRFYVFYWLPIAMVAWFAGQRWGYAAVVASGACWALANGTEWLAERPSVLVWNTAVSVLSFALLAHLIARLRLLVDQEHETARTDYLTGIANARAMSEALQAEIGRARRRGAPLTLAYVDLDDFKQVNDRLGHEAGDRALAAIAQAIRGNLRAGDSVARIGGDEFAFLLPETDQAQAPAVVDRVLARMREAVTRARLSITFSVGAVTCRGFDGTAEELLRRADGLMYEAKQGGKDAVRSATIVGADEEAATTTRAGPASAY
ncbi:MAG TPA: GGDEF domain-containing protein [Thermoanaerobaculaceae bacterium]|nr:GGDEF domain-containing protein [Thermoanaerobaculaceae bacterium]